MKTSRFIILYTLLLFCASLSFAQKVQVGKYTFPKDNSIYYGELVSGKPNGKGKTTFKTGDTYEGEYVKGKRQGYGIYTFTDGEKYEGSWYQDHQHGKGIYYFVNNEWEKYDGMWYLDYMQGDGTMYYTNGDIYIGEWLQDKRNGQGKYIYSNGEVYSGSWENDILIHSSVQNDVDITQKKDKTNIAEKGTSIRVGNRHVIYLAKPSYTDSLSEGMVEVSVEVNEVGDVINAYVINSTTSETLNKAALDAAKQSKFSEGRFTEIGTVTYNFKLK